MCVRLFEERYETSRSHVSSMVVHMYMLSFLSLTQGIWVVWWMRRGARIDCWWLNFLVWMLFLSGMFCVGLTAYKLIHYPFTWSLAVGYIKGGVVVLTIVIMMR